jgi:hypothetical protein
MKIIAFLLLCWFALAHIACIFENGFFYRHMKRLGIPCSFLRSSHLGYLSDVYRAWGEANGVDVDDRLKIRKYLAINMFLSWIGFAIAMIVILGSRTNPSTLP